MPATNRLKAGTAIMTQMKAQFAPRSEHTYSRLQKPINYACLKKITLF
jgi:hypothetical protein